MEDIMKQKLILFTLTTLTLFFWQGCQADNRPDIVIQNETPFQLELQIHNSNRTAPIDPWSRKLAILHSTGQHKIQAKLNGKNQGQPIALNQLPILPQVTNLKMPDGRKIITLMYPFKPMNKKITQVHVVVPAYCTTRKFNNDPNKIIILEYNTWLRHCIAMHGDEPVVRSKLIPAMIKGLCIPFAPDVVVFNEVFDVDAKQPLIEGMKKIGYKYYTNPIGMGPELTPIPSLWNRYVAKIKHAKLSNGGVMIFSRFPIVETKEHLFKAASFEDGMANKGVQLVKINKNGKQYYIAGTHLDAAGGATIRAQQITEMDKFFNTLKLSKEIPLFVVGDLNMGKGTPEQVQAFKKANLQMAEMKGNPFSFDGTKNMIAFNPRYPNARHFIDYIAYKKDHRNPGKFHSTIIVTKSPLPWTASEDFFVPGIDIPRVKSFERNRNRFLSDYGLKGVGTPTHKTYQKRTGYAVPPRNFNVPRAHDLSDHFPQIAVADCTETKQVIQKKKELEKTKQEVKQKLTQEKNLKKQLKDLEGKLKKIRIKLHKKTKTQQRILRTQGTARTKQARQAQNEIKKAMAEVKPQLDKIKAQKKQLEEKLAEIKTLKAKMAIQQKKLETLKKQ